jgi:tripartite-type tricarboxylate transporter receptor subunit TctC
VGSAQQVLLDYRPGAGGTIAVQQLVRARPDGHLVLSATEKFSDIVPYLNPVRHDPMKEMVPVARDVLPRMKEVPNGILTIGSSER